MRVKHKDNKTKTIEIKLEISYLYFSTHFYWFNFVYAEFLYVIPLYDMPIDWMPNECLLCVLFVMHIDQT